MRQENTYIVVFATAASRQEAQTIARALIDEQLAACVNISGGLHSFFRWKGAVDEAQESLLVIKSRRELFEKIAGRIRQLHSYDCPEIIALPVLAGQREYLDWIDESVRKPE